MVQRRGSRSGDRRSHRGGALRGLPEPERPLRLAAGARRGAVVAHDAGRISDSVLYSIGRIWVWFAELLLIYLVLAFPTGRLASRADRLLVRAGALVVALYLVSALLGGVPGAEPVGQLRDRLPGQRLHAAELRARLRGSPAHAGAASGECAPLRRCGAAAGSALGERQQPDACGARARASRGRRANGCDRGLPDCPRSGPGVRAHRGARFDRAPGDAGRIGRVLDRTRAFACPRRAGAGQAQRGPRPTERRGATAGDRGGGRRSVARDRLPHVGRSSRVGGRQRPPGGAAGERRSRARRRRSGAVACLSRR